MEENKRKEIEVSKVVLPVLEEGEKNREKSNFHEDIHKLLDLKITMSANLGEKCLTVGEINEIRVGSVIEVDRIPGHMMEIQVGNEPLALGEIIPMENKFGLVISEVIADGKNKMLKKMNRNGEID